MEEYASHQKLAIVLELDTVVLDVLLLPVELFLVRTAVLVTHLILVDVLEDGWVLIVLDSIVPHLVNMEVYALDPIYAIVVTQVVISVISAVYSTALHARTMVPA